MSEPVCFNCGLPDPRVRASVVLRERDGNPYKHDSTRVLPFCGEECARQTTFLQLHTVSTPDRVTRFLAGKPITYAEFKAKVPVAVERRPSGQDRSETIAEARVNSGAAEAENGLLGLPHAEPENGGFPNAKRRGGRPRKWKNDAERMRARRRADKPSSPGAA
jgi:hypothetical protein